MLNTGQSTYSSLGDHCTALLAHSELKPKSVVDNNSSQNLTSNEPITPSCLSDDECNEFELPLGNLIIDLDADIEKNTESCSPTPSTSSSPPLTSTLIASALTTTSNTTITTTITKSTLKDQFLPQQFDVLYAAKMPKDYCRDNLVGISGSLSSTSSSSLSTTASCASNSTISNADNHNGTSTEHNHANSASRATTANVEHQSLKMKIKRKSIGGKSSESKLEIVSSSGKVEDETTTANGSSGVSSSSSSSNADKPSKHSSAKSKSGSHKDKREKKERDGKSSNVGSSKSNDLNGNSNEPNSSTKSTNSDTAMACNPPANKYANGDNSSKNTSINDSFASSSPKKAKLDSNSLPGIKISTSKLKAETKNVATLTSKGTVTEPECFGPCEPGTSVTLEGIVWQESEGGVLVVNVTWRGKTYVGTLLDCTKHDWAPPRFCDSPTNGDYDCKNSKNSRSKRTRGSSVEPDTRIFHSKLRNGKRRRNQFTVPSSPVKIEPTTLSSSSVSVSKRTTRNSKDAAESRLTPPIVRDHSETHKTIERIENAESLAMNEDSSNFEVVAPEAGNCVASAEETTTDNEGKESYATSDVEMSTIDMEPESTASMSNKPEPEEELDDKVIDNATKAVEFNLTETHAPYESSAKSPAYSDISDANDGEEDDSAFGDLGASNKTAEIVASPFTFFPTNQEEPLPPPALNELKMENNGSIDYSASTNVTSAITSTTTVPTSGSVVAKEFAPNSFGHTSFALTPAVTSNSLNCLPTGIPKVATTIASNHLLASKPASFPYPIMSSLPYSIDSGLPMTIPTSLPDNGSGYKANYDVSFLKDKTNEKSRYKPNSLDTHAGNIQATSSHSPFGGISSTPLTAVAPPPKVASPYDFNSYEKQRQQEEEQQMMRHPRADHLTSGMFGQMRSDSSKPIIPNQKPTVDHGAQKAIKEEPVKPTMETTGPPPPPTNSYYLPQPFLTHSPGPGTSFMPPFDQFLPNFRPPIRFPPLGHPTDLANPNNGMMMLHHPGPPGLPGLPPLPPPPPPHNKGNLALDMLQKASQQYNNHKMQELQERALMSPKSNGGKLRISPSTLQSPHPHSLLPAPPNSSSSPSAALTGGPPGIVGGSKKDDFSRSPPPQRHLHTHHHTHVGVAYPIYDPYGALIQQAASGCINPFAPK